MAVLQNGMAHVLPACSSLFFYADKWNSADWSLTICIEGRAYFVLAGMLTFLSMKASDLGAVPNPMFSSSTEYAPQLPGTSCA